MAAIGKNVGERGAIAEHRAEVEGMARGGRRAIEVGRARNRDGPEENERAGSSRPDCARPERTRPSAALRRPSAYPERQARTHSEHRGVIWHRTDARTRRKAF